MSLEKLILEQFESKFGGSPKLVKAPGRINLIGDHTDYHQGFVLPASVDLYITVAIRKSPTRLNRVYSLDFDQYIEFEQSEFIGNEKNLKGWVKYLVGMLDWIHSVKENFHPIDLVIGGTIPVGGGMSSSAALCNALGLAFSLEAQINLDPKKIIFAAQATEHTYAGVNCGIMDQFASMFGKKNSAVFLDCKTLDFEYVHIDLSEYCFVLLDTTVKHSLADSEYNARQLECSGGLKLIQQDFPSIQSLRDISMDLLISYRATMPEKIFDRCMFVIEENQRVIDSKKLLSNAGFVSFGKLMIESHKGLQLKYEVSCTELDFLVDLANQFIGVSGARMMGGGFGGCTINLVERRFKEGFIQHAKLSYLNMFGLNLKSYELEILDGAYASIC
ncbi:MAG: galactokinase [Mongoliitalea sp.]